MPAHVRSAEQASPLPRWARVLDGLALLLLILAIVADLFGGIRLEVWGTALLSLRTPWKLVADAIAVLAIRHALHPADNALQRLLLAIPILRHRARTYGRAVLAVLPDGFWPALGLSLATRLPVLIIGYIAVIHLRYPIDGQPEWRVSTDELANLPARWDTGWYLGIALDGYARDVRVEGQQNFAFFPAFPSLMWAMSKMLWANADDPARLVWAGVIVSLCAFFVALIYLYKLAKAHVGAETALVGLTLLSSYPFAVFFSAAYTESLFLLTAAATFWHFSQRHVVAAAAWGLLAGLVRPNGWTLSVPLAILALPAIFPTQMRLWTRLLVARGEGASAPRTPAYGLIAAVAAPFVGLLLHSAYLYWVTGDPLAWARVMKYWNRDYQGIQMIGHDLSDFASFGLIEYLTQRPTDLLNAMALLFALISVAPVSRKLGVGYGLFVLINVMLPAVSGGLVSIGRYSSVLFPAFFWLASAVPTPLRPAVVAFFALGEGLAAVFFFTWREVY